MKDKEREKYKEYIEYLKSCKTLSGKEDCENEAIKHCIMFEAELAALEQLQESKEHLHSSVREEPQGADEREIAPTNKEITTALSVLAYQNGLSCDDIKAAIGNYIVGNNKQSQEEERNCNDCIYLNNDYKCWAVMGKPDQSNPLCEFKHKSQIIQPEQQPKDGAGQSAEEWLKENYHEFILHCNATGRSLPFFCNMLEAYAPQKMQSKLPSDKEVGIWFDENIGYDKDKPCSASSAIYKFRLYLIDYTKNNKIQ